MPRPAPFHPAPDFVLLGVQAPLRDRHWVALYASTELTRAELEYERDSSPAWWAIDAPLVVPQPRVMLTAQLRSYVVTMAPTYREAFDSLWKFWQPAATQPTPQLTDSPREIST